MSNFMGVPVDAPPLLPPRISFVDSTLAPDSSELATLHKMLPPGSKGIPWGLGANYRSIVGSGHSDRFAFCDHPTLGLGSRSSVAYATPFGISASDTCSTFSWEIADYWPRALAKLAAWESYEIANEFWTGSLTVAGKFDFPNFYLANASGTGVQATVLTTVSIPKSVDGMSRLDAELAECLHGARGMLHVSPRIFNDLHIGNAVTVVGTVSYTPLGSVIVTDAGYPGTDLSGNEPGDGSEWIFGTGLVKTYRSEPEVYPKDMVQATDRDINETTVRAESAAMVVVDPGCLLAINVLAPGF